MNCLCCGKQLRQNESNMWHKACIRRFFGTPVIPQFDFDDEIIGDLVAASVSEGLTVPGVQKKLSLHLFSEKNNPRFTLVNYPTGYILKPRVKEFENLPELEHLVMTMAERCGISVVPHALVSSKGDYAYITKRIDRVFGKQAVQYLAMEDFCQLDLRLTADKYKGSYERCAMIIEKYSSRKMLDLSEMFIRLVFCFMVGNSDMHLKNFSLIETSEGSGKYILSPAYDLLPVNLVMPEDKEELALTLNGKKQNVRRKDFFAFSKKCSISDVAANKMIERLLSLVPVLLSLCDESDLPKDRKDGLKELIRNRCNRLAK